MSRVRRAIAVVVAVVALVAVLAPGTAAAPTSQTQSCGYGIPGQACHALYGSTTYLHLGNAEYYAVNYWFLAENALRDCTGGANPTGWVGSTSTYRAGDNIVVAHAYIFNAVWRRVVHAWGTVSGVDSGNWQIALDSNGRSACVAY